MVRTRRIKRGGMFPSPSQKRKSLYNMQRMLGDENSSRPFGKQNMQLTRLAEETAFPRNISQGEKRISRMLKKRTPAEIQRDREMNKQLSMRPLLPTLARMEKEQQILIKELKSIASMDKKGEFDRLITQCDRDRELLKNFIYEKLSNSEGFMKMKKGHHDPLLNRDLNDIKVTGELKDIVNRCSRNRIELMNIIRDVYPQLNDIMGASGLVKHGVAKYLENPHQPGYNFVKGSLDKLLDDDRFIFVDPFEDDKQTETNILEQSGSMDPKTGEWWSRSDPESPFYPGFKYLGGSKKKRRTRKKSKRKTRKTRKTRSRKCN